MTDIVMYVKQTCPYCVMAKRLLTDKGQTWTEIDVEREPARRSEMVERSGRYTVPQVFVNGELIGGADADLMCAAGKRLTLQQAEIPVAA